MRISFAPFCFLGNKIPAPTFVAPKPGEGGFPHQIVVKLTNLLPKTRHQAPIFIYKWLWKSRL